MQCCNMLLQPATCSVAPTCNAQRATRIGCNGRHAQGIGCDRQHATCLTRPAQGSNGLAPTTSGPDLAHPSPPLPGLHSPLPSAPRMGSPLPASVPGLGSALRLVHRDCVHPGHVCTGTGPPSIACRHGRPCHAPLSLRNGRTATTGALSCDQWNRTTSTAV